MNDTQFASWMKRVDTSDAVAPLPDSEAIWWRAQLRRRLVDEERATRPIRIANQFACAVCFMGAVVLAAVMTWRS